MNELLKHAFVPVELVKKTVEVVDHATGEKHTAAVYVKPLSFASATEDLKSVGGTEEEAIARRIAWSIRDEAGAPIFTPEQITGEGGKALSTSLTYELLRVIGEVNHLGKMEA